MIALDCVAVIHFGSVALTAECLRSVLELDPPPARRLLLWNDPDSSPEELADELLAAFEAIEPGENLGYAGGANLLAEHATTAGASGLWLLNNDTVVAPDAGAILAASGADPDVAMVGPRIISAEDGRIWHDGGEIVWPEARPRSRGFGEVPGPPEDPCPVGFVCGCAPWIRLSAFHEVGGFDERFFLYYEDVDLGLRLSAAGYRLLHASRAEVRHIGSAAVGRRTPSSRYYRLRNRRLLRDLHASAGDEAPAVAAREARVARSRAWRYRWLGRRAEAVALRAALADHAAGRYGRWDPDR